MSIASNFPSIRPSLLLDFANTKALDPRITFTRASTATYYDGKTVAKAEQNLLVQSQDFTTSWVNTNSSDTANTSAAPDGTTTADTITAAAGTGITPLISQFALASTSGLDYAFSVFAKAGTYSVLQLTNINFQASSAHANFDLSAGTVGTSANCTAAIQDVGSGWYRCSIVFSATTTATNGAVYAVLSASTSANRFATWNPVGTETILLWGAQLEQRSSVTAYTATTTQPITNYVPQLLTAASGVARFDHNPTTDESLGLLIEEQRTNLFTYSEQFNNAAWPKAQASITANTVVAPDGTLTGDKLVEDSTNTNHWVIQNAPVTSGATYTMSFYAKAAERIQVAGFGGAGGYGTLVSVLFDLVALTTQVLSGSATATITDVGNGWRRCTWTATATATATPSHFIGLASGGAVAYTGNGYSGAYIWGAQLEAGAFSTSYIPTTNAQVTRSADAASMTGTNFSSWYRADEGTVYAEGRTSSTVATANYSIFSITDGTAANRIQCRLSNAATNTNFIVRTSDVNVFNSVAADYSPNNRRMALAYKASDFAGVRDGGVVATGASGAVPAVNFLNIGSTSPANTETLNGTIRKIAFYPARLTNAQLQALTS